ncbi:MAG TPA: DUF6458 family protein [Solirubrobacterales bacterium]|nr:DUF6458 family protein [Solirubrobacterales bacterium]
MTIGSSVFLLALGAILRYAVADSIEGVDLSVVGLILMLAGAIGLVVGTFMTLAARRRYPGEPYAADPYATREPPPPRY